MMRNLRNKLSDVKDTLELIGLLLLALLLAPFVKDDDYTPINIDYIDFDPGEWE